MNQNRTIDWPRLARRATRSVAAAVLACVVAVPAHAVSIAIVPSVASVDTGGTFSLDIVIGDLGDQVVSGFDLDLVYDATLFNATGVDFGTGLGPDASLQFPSFALGAGRIDFSNLALYSDAELAALQGTSVRLARLNFGAIGAGSGLFSLDAKTAPGILAIGRDALPLEFASVGTATVQATRPSAVPEPGTAGLALCALLAAAAVRRRASRGAC